MDDERFFIRWLRKMSKQFLRTPVLVGWRWSISVERDRGFVLVLRRCRRTLDRGVLLSLLLWLFL